MKKLVSILAVLLMVVGISTQAFAYFEPQNLMVTIYNPIDNEVALDLGHYSSLDRTPSSNQNLSGANTFGLSDFGSNVDSWSDLRAGVYVASSDYMTYADLYFATTKETAPTVNWNLWESMRNASLGMSSYYKYADTNQDGKFVGSSASIQGYERSMNMDQTTRGFMSGFNVDFRDADISLADLDTVGFVDVYLYQFDLFTGSYVPGTEGAYQGIVRLSADGSVTFNPNPVPVPGALILFASGLVGLIGIRRKNA